MMLPAALLLTGLLAASGPCFTDVTLDSGIPVVKYGEGVNFCDLDGDGLPELFLPNVKVRANLFLNKGGCRFEDVSEARGIKDGKAVGAVFADFDGDGLIDLYLVRGSFQPGKNILYRQGTDGVFRDVAAAAGVKGMRNGIAATASDLDGDGLADIVVSNWGGNIMYRNEGGKSFADVTGKAGLSGDYQGWGAVASDFNGDGRPDLLFVGGSAEKPMSPLLFINEGGGRFRDATKESGIGGVGWSMGAVSADFDGDGSMDVYIADYTGRDRLFLNDGKGHFRDVTEESGINAGADVGVTAGDFDGDLRPDIAVAGYNGPARLFRNLGGGRFEEVRDTGFQPYKKNQGIAFADVDGDGDLDLYVANFDGKNRLYRNETGGGPFIRIRPKTGKSPAFGAVVRLYGSGPDGKKTLLSVQDIQSAYGFGSQSPPEAIFRLSDDGPRDVTITFVDGKKIEKTGMKPGTYDIVE